MKQIYTLCLLALLLSSAAGAQNNHKKIFDHYAAQNFSGSVLVATNGKIEYANAAGLANRTYEIKLDTQSRFRICSITKTFTAVLIMQLWEQQKLDLKAPISRYLPEYTGEGKDQITVENLLTYSSGLDNVDQREEAVYSSLMSPNVLIEKYGNGKPLTKPGTQFSYKNSDFIILGKIIEKITGKSFASALDEHILKPLKMTDTGYLRNSDIVPGLATPYLFDKTTLAFRNDDPYWIDNFYAAGAMYSTVEDLLKFDQAIFGATIIKKKTRDLMLTPNPALYSVGYGFWISSVKFGAIETLAADRQGDISGSKASWIHLINENKTVIILANSDAVNINEMREKLAMVSLKQKVELPSAKSPAKK